MCPRRAKKIMILSRSEYLVILTPHRYRRTSTTVSSPSVRGGHASETRPASSDMPPHHPACMRAQCDAPVALLPPSAPVLPNPVAFDHGIYPFDFARRALTSGPPHPVVLGQPIGTHWSNIQGRPTARSPPCRPHAFVSPSRCRRQRRS